MARRERTPLGEAFRWLRREYLRTGNGKVVTQAELAGMLNVSSSYVAMIETGKKGITDARARAIAHIVARSREDEAHIVVRFQTALMQMKMPEGTKEFEFMHVRPAGAEKADQPWPEWCAEVRARMQDQELTVEALASQCGLNAHYLEEIRQGRLFAQRTDVRTIADALGADVADHLLLAGYLPREGVGILSYIERLIAASTSEDQRKRTFLDAVLRYLLEEEPEG